MAFLADLSAGAVGGLVQGIGNILDNIFTSDEERAKAQLAMEKVAQLPMLQQIEVNLKEAEHPSTFVAGWRPAVGWMCTLGIGYQFILRPLLDWVASLATAFSGHTWTAAPKLDVVELITLLLAMLGVAGYRTYEKLSGVARENMQQNRQVASKYP